MADKTITPEEAYHLNYVKPGSKEHQAQLELGYGMSKAKAEQIIKERKENPALWPYEMLEKAEALLAALNSAPQVIDTQPGWHRQRG